VVVGTEQLNMRVTDASLPNFSVLTSALLVGAKNDGQDYFGAMVVKRRSLNEVEASRSHLFSEP
jgi:hypothetical protein